MYLKYAQLKVSPRPRKHDYYKRNLTSVRKRHKSTEKLIKKGKCSVENRGNRKVELNLQKSAPRCDIPKHCKREPRKGKS